MDKPKLYLAAPYAERGEMAKLAEANPEFEYTSRWIYQDPTIPDTGIGGASDPHKYAMKDLSDVLEADVFVCFSEPQRARGGKHFETGFAFAAGKQVAVVGELEHMFQAINIIQHFDTWEDCKAWLLTL